MTTFATPKPITVTIDLFVADVRIVASDRANTIVEVRPSNKSRSADVRAAELTLVEYSNGQLLIKGPKQRVRFGIGSGEAFVGVGSSEALDVTIQLPTGSHVHGEMVVGELRAQGELGNCQVKTGAGGIALDQAGSLILETGSGDITAERAIGEASIITGSGTVRIHEMNGSAAIKNTNGSSHIGEISGELRLSSAHGNISIDRAQASIVAKTANGTIRINEIVRGSTLLETAYGEVTVGVREGTAVWLDVRSQYGSVHNFLNAGGPRKSDETAEVRVRTIHGDIVIRRSKAVPTMRNKSR